MTVQIYGTVNDRLVRGRFGSVSRQRKLNVSGLPLQWRGGDVNAGWLTLTASPAFVAIIWQSVAVQHLNFANTS